MTYEPREPRIDALARMTQNILRANGYDVEPSDPVVWCGTCRETAALPRVRDRG